MLGFLKQRTNVPRENQCITFGGIPIAREQESLHFLLSGSTGVGKSTAVVEMLSRIVGRGDRAVIADPNGFYLSRFYREGDAILNVHDRRSVGWGLFVEIRRPYDFDKLARSIVPDGNGADRAWHFYAQVLIAEVMRGLAMRGESSTSRLVEILTTSSSEQLKALVAGSAATGLFDKDAAKALASTRFILSAFLNPYQYLKPSDFSLRNWLETGRGNLFLTWREDMSTSLAPLISAWIDVLCSATLSMAPDPHRRVWLVLDELGTLGKIGSLEHALTKGRKHGLCCIAGLQTTSQLDRIYGREEAVVLRSCFRNFAAFATAKIDPDTSEIFSRAIGEREVDRPIESESRGSSGSSKSINIQRIRERLVLPSELNELPDLTCYLCLAGDQPARRVKLSPRNMPIVAQAVEE